MANFKREPAGRAFTGEIRDIKEGEKVGEGEYASTHYTLPTSGTVTRILVMGTLTEIEDVGNDQPYMKGRVIDSSGSINVYAGQYQPEAAQFLLDAETPAYVAVVGKPKIYTTDDGNQIISISAESITAITSVQRDIWIQETARETMFRMKEMEDSDKKSAYKDMIEVALESLSA